MKNFINYIKTQVPELITFLIYVFIAIVIPCFGIKGFLTAGIAAFGTIVIVLIVKTVKFFKGFKQFKS